MERIPENKGFTLVEIMIVVALAVILVGVLITAMIETRDIFNVTTTSATVEENTRTAIARLTQELMTTDKDKISIARDVCTNGSACPGTDTITYVLPKYSSGTPVLTSDGEVDWDTDNPVKVGLNSSDAAQLIRIQGGESVVLANNVKKINFVDHNLDSSLYLDELKVTIEVEKTTPRGRVYTVTSTGVVNMRN